MFDRDKPFNDLPFLPPIGDIETKALWRQTTKARVALESLREKAKRIPREKVLIQGLVLLESKYSSEIENIFTTHDKVYEADTLESNEIDPNTKEVTRYSQALYKGVKYIENRPLSTNTFTSIYQTIKETTADVRTGTGTKIKNSITDEYIYTPPEGENNIRKLLKNLEEFIHSESELDPLIKMAISHYQFEAIHPFSDGNGRTGRVINILQLIEYKLLDNPILFLSKYIIENKNKYYAGLQNVTENSNWEEWILYMLQGVEIMSHRTIQKIEAIFENMIKFSDTVREKDSSLHSKDLIHLLFEHPFIRISDLEKGMEISRQTASKHLKKLSDLGLLTSFKRGAEIIYVNDSFYRELKKDL